MARVLVVLHSVEEPLGALEPTLLSDGHSLEQRVAPNGLPPSLADGAYDAIVVMGGSMSAYETERYPFLSQEIRLLGEALATGRPALGICLGSQLLATAAGGRVQRGRVLEIGWLPVRRVRDDPWLDGWPEAFEPLHWHGDTFELPPGGTLVASSERYAHQAFRVGSGLGLQFHVEATERLARDWWTDPGLADHWRPPPGHLERSAEAAARMAPHAAALMRAFGAAARGRSD